MNEIAELKIVPETATQTFPITPNLADQLENRALRTGFWDVIHHDRYFMVCYLALGILFFNVVSVGYPVNPGIDYFSYLMNYYGFYNEGMAFRSIGSAQIIGMISQHGYGLFQYSMLFFYIIFLVTVYYSAQFFGVVVARVVSIIMLFHFQLTMLMHSVDSGAMLAIGISIWSAFVLRLYRKKSLATYMILGLVSFALVLIKPSTLTFIMFCLYPILCHGISKKYLLGSLVFITAFILGAVTLSTLNYYRYDRFMVAANSSSVFPALSVFRYTFTFAAENGPASKKLFELVQTKLIDTPLYKRHNIDIKTFFSRYDPKTWVDLHSMDYYEKGVLRKAAIEAIIAKPSKFIFWSIINPTYRMLTEKYPGITPSPEIIEPDSEKKIIPDTGDAEAVSGGEPQFLPYPLTMSFENFYQMYPETREQAEIDHEQAMQKVAYDLQRKYTKAGDYYQNAVHFYIADGIISFLCNIIPPILFFVGSSLLLLPKIKTAEVRLLLLMTIASLSVVILSSMVSVYTRYRVPFDFIFILAGVVGIMNSTLLKKLVTKMDSE